jgi:hypothetical protein
MSKYNLLVDEKRWRHKSIFRKKRQNSLCYLIASLIPKVVQVAAIALLSPCLDLLSIYNFISEFIA